MNKCRRLEWGMLVVFCSDSSEAMAMAMANTELVTGYVSGARVRPSRLDPSQ